MAATLARLVQQGDPAGAAHDDIGQSRASTRRKSSSLTRRSFQWPYVLPLGVLTCLTTRPVIESKRLPELVSS
jgi:hypothetical protein